MHNTISKRLSDSQALLTALLADAELQARIEQAAVLCIESLQRGGKILFCGNGGSAADAQHLAAELSGRFYYDRPPLRGEALHVNTSYLTAVANDYGYDQVFARQVRGSCQQGDVLVGISTSGNSPNILLAMEAAREIGVQTIALTGDGGGAMKTCCDLLIAVPSSDTPRIQECHILIGHILCELFDSRMFPQEKSR